MLVMATLRDLMDVVDQWEPQMMMFCQHYPAFIAITFENKPAVTLTIVTAIRLSKLTRILSINTFNAFRSWGPSSIRETRSSKSQIRSSVIRSWRVLSLTAWAKVLFWNVWRIYQRHQKCHKAINVKSNSNMCCYKINFFWVEAHLHKCIQDVFARSWRTTCQAKFKCLWHLLYWQISLQCYFTQT